MLCAYLSTSRSVSIVTERHVVTARYEDSEGITMLTITLVFAHE